MAFTVLYSKRWRFHKDDRLYQQKSPFEDWLSKSPAERHNAVFAFNTHQGMDCSIHVYFIPDNDGLSGSFMYLIDDEYGDTQVVARVLIHTEKKTLIILNIEYHMFNDDAHDFDSNPVHVYGGTKCYKRIQAKKHNRDNPFNDMIKYFFGDGWRYHIGWNKHIKKNLFRQFMKKTKVLPLPKDMTEEVANNLLSQWDHIPYITRKEGEDLEKLAKDYVGVPSDWGRYYLWGCVVGVYNTIRS